MQIKVLPELGKSFKSEVVIRTINRSVTPRTNIVKSTRYFQPSLRNSPTLDKSSENLSMVTPDITKSTSLSCKIKTLLNTRRANLSALNKKKLKQTSKKISILHYEEAINSLCIITKCTKERIPILSILHGFISLKLAVDVKVLGVILSTLIQKQDIKSGWFSSKELLLVCEDLRANRLAKAIQSGIYKKNYSKKTLIFENIIEVLQGWWGEIKKENSQNATSKNISKYLFSIGAVDSTQDATKLFLRHGQEITYKQFLCVHSKAIFRLMLNEIGNVSSASLYRLMSPDLAIIAKCRKNLIDSVKGDKNLLKSLQECDSYNH